MDPVSRKISPYAAQLRREQTPQEHAFWLAARDRRLGGFKFRRQMTIGPFVADFVCIEARVVVEIDGGQHSAAGDAGRTAFLEARKYLVVRFWNNEVAGNLSGVLAATLAMLVERKESKPLTQLSPVRTGEG